METRDWQSSEEKVLARGATQAEILSDSLYTLKELLTFLPLHTPGAEAHIVELADRIIAQSAVLLDVAGALAPSSPGPDRLVSGFESIGEDG